MPIPKKRTRKKRATAADAVLVGEMVEAADPGLASLLEDPIPDESRSATGPRLNPAPPFLLRHWAANWDVGTLDGASVWLPEVSMHLLVRGAGGIRTPGLHEPESSAYADAVMSARRDGWVYLPLDRVIDDPALLPVGVAPGRYRRVVRGHHPITRAPVEAWVKAWCVPVQGLPNAPLSFALDRPSWDRWRASLVAEGLIRPPIEAARAVYLGTIRRHLSRARASNMAESIRAPRVAQLERRLAAATSAEVPA